MAAVAEPEPAQVLAKCMKKSYKNRAAKIRRDVHIPYDPRYPWTREYGNRVCLKWLNRVLEEMRTDTRHVSKQGSRREPIRFLI